MKKGVIKFDNCWVYLDGLICKTLFQDGKYCIGTTGLDRPDQVNSAKNMGYDLTEEGLSKMLFEHEVAHNFIMKKLGKPYSDVHRLLAVHGQGNLTISQEIICHNEEMIIGAFQTYINKGILYSHFKNTGLDPEQTRKEFIHFLNTINLKLC
jgi:hypothetical protein